MKVDPEDSCSKDNNFFQIRVLVFLFTVVYGCSGAAFLAWREYSSSIIVSVPRENLPAYHRIQSDDLVQRHFPKANLDSSALTRSESILGCYTLTAIPEGEPINAAQLIETDRLKNHVVVSIPATPALISGGALKAGDSVDITLVPNVESAQSENTPTIFNNVFILDIVQNQASMSGSSDSPFVVTVALPTSVSQRFIAQQATTAVLFTHRPWGADDQALLQRPRCSIP